SSCAPAALGLCNSGLGPGAAFSSLRAGRPFGLSATPKFLGNSRVSFGLPVGPWADFVVRSPGAGREEFPQAEMVHWGMVPEQDRHPVEARDASYGPVVEADTVTDLEQPTPEAWDEGHAGGAAATT